MTLTVLLIPILTLLCVFLRHAFQYLNDRIRLLRLQTVTTAMNAEAIAHLNEYKYLNWQSWLPEFPEQQQQTSSHFFPKSCDHLIVEIPAKNRKKTCWDLLGPVCGPLARRIRIPKGLNMFTHRGGKLNDGEEYCVSKDPYPLQIKCNVKWGYLKYVPEQRRWECKSRVPGIYDSDTNSFIACKQGGGYLLDVKKDRMVDYKTLSPEDLYETPEFYQCKCARGFVSQPDISRSVCYADPCLTHLPEDVDIPGYDKISGTCDCGKYYKNIHDNPKLPCTACPNPTYDELRRYYRILRRLDGVTTGPGDIQN